MTWLEITGILGLVITPVSSIVSWIAGTRSRKNSIYQEMMRTIETLTAQNAKYNQSIINLQNEIIEVRKENAELKAGQSEMTRQLETLQRENKELKEIITKK